MFRRAAWETTNQGLKTYRTSDLARAVGIHPNTVRLYVEWGLIPAVEKGPTGYRLFTQRHLDCLRLARMIYAADYPGRGLRAAGKEIIEYAVGDDWEGALEKANNYLDTVRLELDRANIAAALLEQWAQNREFEPDKNPLTISEVSRQLDVSLDVIRNWERNGLINVPRNSYNGYRLFGKKEVERLQIIRILNHAGYSHMAILRMFIELDKGNLVSLKKVLDTPREDEDIFTAADHWLSTLHQQELMAQGVIQLIEAQLAKEQSPAEL
jgi:DNA-binding transcriptional MerR regulator